MNFVRNGSYSVFGLQVGHLQEIAVYFYMW